MLISVLTRNGGIGTDTVCTRLGKGWLFLVWNGAVSHNWG